MIACDDVRAIGGAIALGVVDTNRQAEVNAHLDACLSCWESCTALRRMAGAVGYAAPAIPVPDDLKARLLVRLTKPAPETATPHAELTTFLPVRDDVPVWYRRIETVSAWAVVAILVAVLLWQQHDQAARLSDWQRQAAEWDVTRHQLATNLNRARKDLEAASIVPPAEVRTIALAGARRAPFARGTVMWRRDEQSWMLTADHLPPCPPGQRAVLWAMCGQRQITIASFTPTAAGQITLKAFLPKLPAPPTAILVSLEARPGPDRPSGDLLLMGLADTASRPTAP